MIKVVFKDSGGTKRTGKKRLEYDLGAFVLYVRFEKVLADFKSPLLKLVRDHYRFLIHIFNHVLPEARNTSWPETTNDFWSPTVCDTDTHSFKHIIHFHSSFTIIEHFRLKTRQALYTHQSPSDLLNWVYSTYLERQSKKPVKQTRNKAKKKVKYQCPGGYSLQDFNCIF